jgi:hypothetical protein
MRKSACWFLLIFICLGFIFYIIPTFSVFSSPARYFNVTPDALNLNWTNSYLANVTVTAEVNTANSNNVTIEALSATTPYPDSGPTQNYTQGDTRDACLKIQLLAENKTVTALNGNTTTNSSIFTISHNHSECYPGRYYTGKFTFRNVSTNENANITIFIDIPISTANTLSNITAKGNFSGSIPINATSYHSFYFNATSSNTSEIINATGIVINLTSSADVDMFLFDDSGILRAKSINKTANSEWLDYSFLPTSSAMWEIRIFGNSTSSAISYSGTIFFITMNITDSAGNTPSIINFGTLNATTNTSASIFLKSEGNYTLTNVAESKELYHVTRFSGSDTSNYTFLVPDSSIVSKVKVSLNWTGASNYSFKLFNQDGTLMTSSTNKYVYANRTKAMQEEYAETTDIGSSNKYWRVEVTDNALANVSYTLNAYLYVYNVSEWIITNYTTMTFNRTNTNGTLITFNASSSAMNGTYEGIIRYRDGNGIGISIPLRAYVTTPMLLVNNTLNTEVFRVDENYGTNLTRVIYFNISNIGDNEMILNFTDSGSLSCYPGSCSGHSANFTYNTTSSVAGRSSKTINVSITFNSSMPANTVYTGWIKINSINSSSNITSHPYSVYTITLRLNLTSALDVRPDFAASDGGRTVKNVSATENITIKVDVFYINGTGPITDLLLGNFTSVWLQERNVTSTLGRIPSSGTLNISAGTNPLYCTGSCPSWGGINHYYLNVTVPANSLGGLYDVHVTATASRESGSFSGEGVNNSYYLAINNTGLYMTAMNSTSFTIGNTSTYMFAVNVSNYGNLSASSATINLTESCSGYSVAYIGMTGSCVGSGSVVTATISPLGYNTSCMVWWNITASATAVACTAYVMGSPLNQWFNPNGINVSITVGGSSSSSDSSTSSSSNTALNTTTYTPNLAFKFSSPISVQQNSSTSTEVGISNTGQTNQNVTFSIGTINSSWYSLNATNLYLVVGRSGGIRVTFTVGNVEVKDYNGTFKATSPTKEITSNFILRVTPAPTTKTQINETLQAYRTNMTSLGQQLNQLKSQGYNVTDVEVKFNELESKVEEAESYIRSGDYNSAYYLFDGIKDLLSGVKSDLTKVKKTGAFGFISLPQGITLYVLIGAGVAVGGFLAYLFWPTRGLTKPAYGAKAEEVKKPKTGQSKLEQLKGLKEKLSNFFKREKNKPKYLLNESS